MHLFCQIIINSLGLGVVLGGSLMITESSLRLAYNVWIVGDDPRGTILDIAYKLLSFRSFISGQ
jgi:hypothetical protein